MASVGRRLNSLSKASKSMSQRAVGLGEIVAMGLMGGAKSSGIYPVFEWDINQWDCSRDING